VKININLDNKKDEIPAPVMKMLYNSQQGYLNNTNTSTFRL